MKTLNPANPTNSGGYSQEQVDALIENSKVYVDTGSFSVSNLSSAGEVTKSISFQLHKTATADQILVSCQNLGASNYWSYLVWYISSITVSSDNKCTIKFLVSNNGGGTSATINFRVSIVY